MAPRLFVYRIVSDFGTAPHISNGYLTLTICKPGIRKSAVVGDYVLALVALQHTQITGKGEDRYYKAAYLFKVTEVVPMLEYKGWCEASAPDKICTNNYFEGNCQYDEYGMQRPGPHGISERNKNLSGKQSLISNHFVAWTSRSPRTLENSEMEQIGLKKDQVKTATRNYFIIPLIYDSQIEALENLITPVINTPLIRPNTTKSCTKRRKNRKSRKNRN